MPTVAAYAAASATEPLAPFRLERRAPRAHEVAIKIQACGICHTDIHQTRNEWGNSTFPMVPGHEITGVVTAIGAQVTKFKPGDRVGVGCFVDSCRSCQPCRRGEEQYCDRGPVFTYNGQEADGTPTQGGYSATIVADENYVLRIPANLPLDGAAPLLCAGITLYSPLRHWHAGPGVRVGIVGLGGLGHMGVKLAHAMGAEVTVFSQSARKREDSRRLGADHFYAVSGAASVAGQERSYDLILNTVSAPLDWSLYLNLLKPDGSLVILGVPPAPVPVHALPLVAGRRTLAGSMIGGIRETQEMLDFCGRAGITSDIETIAIAQVNQAYDRMLKSDVRYRFVIDMATLQ